MTKLPPTRLTPVLRTDFSDQRAWEAVQEAIGTPGEEHSVASVEYIDDRAFQDLTSERILAMVPEDYEHPIIIVADRAAMSSAEIPLLVIDLWDERGREIRVIARELWAIENNLSIANADFFEFADAVGEDGVFRGF